MLRRKMGIQQAPKDQGGQLQSLGPRTKSLFFPDQGWTLCTAPFSEQSNGLKDWPNRPRCTGLEETVRESCSQLKLSVT